MERLEDRQMLAVDIDTGFDGNQTLEEIGFSTHATLFGDEAIINNNELQLGGATIVKTLEDVDPTPQNPLQIEFDFTLQEENGNGIQLVSRTNAEMSGRYTHVVANGVQFSFQQTNAGIYAYETRADGQKSSEAVANYTYYDTALQKGKTYHGIAKDYGNKASMQILDGDTVVIDIAGDITLNPQGTKAFIRQQTAETKLPAVLVDNLVMQESTSQMQDTVIVQDDFSEKLDVDTWKAVTDYNSRANSAEAYTENGHLVLEDSGTIVTQSDVIPTKESPVTIKGKWTPVRDDQSNTHALTVRLRHNGDVNDHPQNSVQLVAYSNLDVFLTKKSDEFYGKITEDKSKSLKIGQEYNFTITDDSEVVRVVFEDGNGNTLIDLQGEAPYDESSSGGRTAFIARDSGRSHLDDITISQVLPVPAESDSGEEEKAEEPAPATKLFELAEDVPLSRKTPHFFTDYVEATPEKPLVIDAQFQYTNDFSSPAVIIAKDTATNHRNNVLEGIYVQMRRTGNVYINQFEGSDANNQTEFAIEPMDINDLVDARVVYDGTTLVVTVSHEGTVIGEHSYTPTYQYPTPKIGTSNVMWDKDTISAIAKEFIVHQGMPVEGSGGEEENNSSDKQLLGSLTESFTTLSGSPSISDEAIVVGARAHLLAHALPERQAGQVYETRMRFTLTDSTDRHIYAYNDTPEGGENHETGYGFIMNDILS